MEEEDVRARTFILAAVLFTVGIFVTGTLDGERTIKGHVTSVSTGPGTYLRGEGPFVATRR